MCQPCTRKFAENGFPLLPGILPKSMNYTPLANAQGVCECHFSGETENVGVDFSRKSEYKVGPVLTKEWENLNLGFF